MVTQREMCIKPAENSGGDAALGARKVDALQPDFPHPREEAQAFALAFERRQHRGRNRVAPLLDGMGDCFSSMP